MKWATEQHTTKLYTGMIKYGVGNRQQQYNNRVLGRWLLLHEQPGIFTLLLHAVSSNTTQHAACHHRVACHSLLSLYGARSTTTLLSCEGSMMVKVKVWLIKSDSQTSTWNTDICVTTSQYTTVAETDINNILKRPWDSGRDHWCNAITHSDAASPLQSYNALTTTTVLLCSLHEHTFGLSNSIEVLIRSACLALCTRTAVRHAGATKAWAPPRAASTVIAQVVFMFNRSSSWYRICMGVVGQACVHVNMLLYDVAGWRRYRLRTQ